MKCTTLVIVVESLMKIVNCQPPCGTIVDGNKVKMWMWIKYMDGSHSVPMWTNYVLFQSWVIRSVSSEKIEDLINLGHRCNGNHS